jgi:uncharacterized protein YaiI (UPF0178 family)
MSSKLTDEEVINKCRRTCCCVACDYFVNKRCIHQKLIVMNTESLPVYLNPSY